MLDESPEKVNRTPPNPLEHKVRIRPWTPDDEAELGAAAARDNHGVAAPTHVVLKEGKIIGYLSINKVPTVLLWLDTKQTKVRDTIDIVNCYENLIAAFGWPGFLLPMQNNSPVKPFVEQAGYVLASPDTTVYFKKL